MHRLIGILSMCIQWLLCVLLAQQSLLACTELRSCVAGRCTVLGFVAPDRLSIKLLPVVCIAETAMASRQQVEVEMR
jgi:hypothetical protein